MQQIIRSRHHREHDVSIRQVSRLVDDRCTQFGQWLRLGTRAVVDRHIATRLDEPFSHCVAHAAGANPANFVIRVDCCHTPDAL